MTRFVDRRTDRPVVGVGIGEPPGQPDLGDPTSAREEARRSGISSALGPLGYGLDIQWAGFGRGATGLALAIDVGLTATAVGGAALVWLELAERLMKVADRLRRSHGQRVALSRGAVKLVCVFDLHRRIGDLTGVRFVGDGSDDAPTEGAFFPGDTYVVRLQRGSERWTYRISASGEILSFAAAASS